MAFAHGINPWHPPMESHGVLAWHSPWLSSMALVHGIRPWQSPMAFAMAIAPAILRPLLPVIAFAHSRDIPIAALGFVHSTHPWYPFPASVHGTRLRLLAMATVQGRRPRRSRMASAHGLHVALSLGSRHCHKEPFLSARSKTGRPVASPGPVL